MSTQSRGCPQGSAGNRDLTAQLLLPTFQLGCLFPARQLRSLDSSAPLRKKKEKKRNMFVKTRNTTKQGVFLRLCRGREGKFLQEMFTPPHTPPPPHPPPARRTGVGILFGRHGKTIIRASELGSLFLCVCRCCSGDLYLKVALFHTDFICQNKAHMHRLPSLYLAPSRCKCESQQACRHQPTL